MSILALAISFISTPVFISFELVLCSLSCFKIFISIVGRRWKWSENGETTRERAEEKKWLKLFDAVAKEWKKLNWKLIHNTVDTSLNGKSIEHKTKTHTPKNNFSLVLFSVSFFMVHFLSKPNTRKKPRKKSQLTNRMKRKKKDRSREWEKKSEINRRKKCDSSDVLVNAENGGCRK